MLAVDGKGCWMDQSGEALVEAARNSPEGWAVVAFAVVAVLFVLVRWGLPVIKELKEKRLDVERYRIEVDEKAQSALDDRERERIKTTQALAEQQRQTNENTKALTTVMTALQARMEESANRSHEMGDRVERIDTTTSHTDGLVAEMHRHMFREGTD